MDDEMAKLMGFSSFGTQPKEKSAPEKKRKREVSDSQSVATQSQVISRPTQTHQPVKDNTANEYGIDLRAYRQGVRNANGDVAYFMPSFIEDPWKHLRKTA